MKKKQLQACLMGLMAVTLGTTALVHDVVGFEPVSVHAEEFEEAEEVEEAAPANLGVSLGNPSIAGQNVSLISTLDQATVRAVAIENMQKLRGEMWDRNPPYNGSTLQQEAAANGLTTREAYVNGIQWNMELEKFAIQRAVEAGIVAGHIRPDDSQYGIGFENLAWGYSMAGAVYTAWGVGELNDLINAKGAWNYDDGHLHNQLNPSLKSFAVSWIGGTAAEALDWGESTNTAGTGMTGQYVTPVKFSTERISKFSITLDKAEYIIGETVKPTVTYDGYKTIAAQVTNNNKAVVGNDFIARSAGTVTFSVAGKSVTAKVVHKPVYRLYNNDLQVHLYTTDANEKDVLQGRDWRYEGISWRTETTNGEPVYRLYHSGLKIHLYTRDANEYKVLATKGWRQEGIAYRSYGAVPIYRLYNAGVKKHLYTRDANEKNILQNRGWKYEGVAWYSQP